MKKLTTILLIFIYAASVTGIGVKAFYCCNKLKSVSAILLLEKQDKDQTGTAEPGCCNTKYSFFKVRDNHTSAPEIAAPLQPAAAIVPVVYNSFICSCDYASTQFAYRSNAPPPLSSCPAYIMNCTYRI